MTEITKCLQKRYGSCGRAGERIVIHIDELWDEFISIADPVVSRHLENRLCTEDWNTFHQGYWELLLARHLRVCGLSPQAMSAKGPDFRTTWDQSTIWIEAVAPSHGSEQIWASPEQTASSDSDDRKVPVFEADKIAILRRWTSALQEKSRKLTSYLNQDVVNIDQSYVIAINSCLLPTLDELGSSGLPWLVETLYGAGTLHISFERETLKRVSEHHDFRIFIPSKMGSPICTNMFLDERYKYLSAVLATVAVPDTVALHGDPYIVVAHNPLAHNKIPLGVFGASEEWVVDDLQPSDVKLKRLT